LWEAADNVEAVRNAADQTAQFNGIFIGIHCQTAIRKEAISKSQMEGLRFWTLREMQGGGGGGNPGCPGIPRRRYRDAAGNEILKEHNVFGKPGKSRRGGHLRDCGWGKKCSA
jgi:hypothetical protein